MRMPVRQPMPRPQPKQMQKAPMSALGGGQVPGANAAAVPNAAMVRQHLMQLMSGKR